MTSQADKNMKRAGELAQPLKADGCIRLLPEFYAAFDIPDEHSDFVSSITTDGVEKIASLIAQVRNETLNEAVSKCLAQAEAYASDEYSTSWFDQLNAKIHCNRCADEINSLKSKEQEQ